MFSSFRLPVAVVGSVGLLVLLAAGTVRAQFPRRGAMPARPAPIPANPSGTIEAIGRGMMRIKSLAGQPYILQIQKEAKVHVTGTAKKDVLGVGGLIFISFFAEVDKRQSEVQNKIGELTLFTFSPERPLGAFPGARPAVSADPAEGDTKSDAKTDAAEDAKSDDPAAGVAAPDTEKPPADARKSRSRSRRSRARGDDEGPDIDGFEIVGRITGIDKAGKITVYVPNPYFKSPVQIELTEDPHIDLDLTDLRSLAMAKPGDKVIARGQQVAPNMVQVNEMAVQLVEPFTMVREEPDKKSSRRSRRSRREEAEKEEAAEGEKAEEKAEERSEEKE